MQMVKTKPGIIVAEQEREISEQSRHELRTRLAQFKCCFVELGSGSGLHLLELAAQNPDTLCIGLEIRFKRAFRTGEKAERDGLTNVLVMRTNARLLKDLFEVGEVAGFFVNYPDPWDKRRWLKNRLLNTEMIATMKELLMPGGTLQTCLQVSGQRTIFQLSLSTSLNLKTNRSACLRPVGAKRPHYNYFSAPLSAT